MPNLINHTELLLGGGPDGYKPHIGSHELTKMGSWDRYCKHEHCIRTQAYLALCSMIVLSPEVNVGKHYQTYINFIRPDIEIGSQCSFIGQIFCTMLAC